MTAGLCLLLWLASAQETPGADAPGSPAVELVRRLASDSFEVRIQAEAELLKLGPKAEEALSKGLSDSDAQVRDQCRQILSKIQQAGQAARFQAFLDDKDDRLTPPLPGWKRFSSLAGNSPAQRKQFLELYRYAEPLFDEPERDPKKAAALVAPRLTAARTALLTPTKEEEVLRELLLLLLLVSDPRVPLEANDYNKVCGVLTILCERAAIIKAFRGKDLLRRLAWDFLKERGTSAARIQTVRSALALELPEARDWAMQQALDKTQPAATRAWAAILAGKVGGKEAITRLEPLLKDSSAVGTFTLGTTKLTTELRDVVLAVVIQGSGRKPEEFGFPYLQAVPGLKTLPSPERLGFADAASRQSAFKKWQDSSK